MEICFGRVSRKVEIQNNCAELWATIVHEIPGLISYRKKLEMHYIDDEGDDICVTTDDELLEALRVGGKTSNGFLSLKLLMNGVEPNTQAEIEATAEQHYDDESTDDDEEEGYVLPAVPPTAPLRADDKKTDETTDILAIVQSAGVTAVAGINTALNSATTEINKVLDQLAGATTQQKQTKEDLESAKAELAEITSKCAESEQQVVQLTHDLDVTKALLSESTEESKNASIRLKDLEKQVSEGATWENKCKAAEQERDQLNQQLQALRSALQALTVTSKPTPVKAEPVAAEVVSNEIIPPSPVVESELPPPYKEPVALPAPSPLELLRQQQLQQLRDMGFSLTLEQLNEKLVTHSGNMEHVVHSLLR